MRKVIGTLVVLALAAVPFFGSSAFATQNDEGHIPVTLCHRTGSVDGGNQHNGYNVITVDLSSIAGIAQLNGHDGHEQVGNGPGPDIIPAASYTVLNGPDKGAVVDYPGKGLDYVFANGDTGAEFLAAGCAFSETPPPPPPTPADITASLTGPSCKAQEYVVTLTNSGETDGEATITTTIDGSSDSSLVSVSAGATVIATVDVSAAADESSTSVVVTFGENTVGSADAVLDCVSDNGGGNPPPPPPPGGDKNPPEPNPPTPNPPVLAETL